MKHSFSSIADERNVICDFTSGKSCGYIPTHQNAHGPVFERTTLESGNNIIMNESACVAIITVVILFCNALFLPSFYEMCMM